MSNSWFRSLFAKRTAPARRASQRVRPSFEALEDRCVPATYTWTGDGGTLPTPDFSWGLFLNWSVSNAGANDGLVPSTNANSPSDIVFPIISDPARKPPAVAGPPFVFAINSIVDANYFVNNITILDDNYRIDSTAARTLTISGEIFANIPDTLGSVTGLSLIGPVGGAGAPSQLQLLFTSGGQSLNAATGAPGVLEISAAITQGATEAGIVKKGGGRMALSGANAFTGQVIINEGQLDGAGNSVLGVSGSLLNGTIVQDGATFGFAGGSIPESLQITGNGLGGVGALAGVTRALDQFRAPNPPLGAPVAWTGPVVLSPSAAIGGTASFAISGQITGTGDLTKVGTNGLTLTNANGYSGQTLINSGRVLITNSNALAPGSTTTVAAGAALVFNASNLVVPENLILNGDGATGGALRMAGAGTSTATGFITLSSTSAIGVSNGSTLVITPPPPPPPAVPPPPNTPTPATGNLIGTPNLRKLDQGTLILPTANPQFTGNSLIENGVVLINDAQALGPAAAAGGGGIAVITSTAGGPTVSGSLQVQGTVAAPNLTLSKPLTLGGPGFGGPFNVSALSVSNVSPTVGTNLTLDTGVTISSATAIDIGSQSSLNVTAVVNSTGGPTASLTRTGTGTLTLANDNTYTGQTNLTSGLNIVTRPNALGADGGRGTVVSSGATLRLANALTLNEDLTLSGSGISIASALQGAIQVAAPGLSTVNGLITLQGGVTSAADMNVGAGAVLNFNGVVSGSADLRKLGLGELQLTGTSSNTFVGFTSVDTGTLVLGKTGGATAVNGPVTVGDSLGGNNADVLRLDAPNQIPIFRPSGAPLVVTVNTSGLFNLNGQRNTLGGLNLTGGEVLTGAGTLTLAGDVTVNANAEQSIISGTVDLGAATRTLTVADGVAPVDLLMNAVITGSGGLTKAGPGLMDLASVATYSGPTNVSGGTLRLAVANALPNTTALTVTAAGLLNLNGFNDTVASLAGNGPVQFNGGRLTVGADNSSSVHSGTLSDGSPASGGLTKVGTGTLTLAGASPAYTGTTNVTAGTLSVTGSIANSPLLLAAGTTLAGTGTVGSTTVAPGSVVAPGVNGPGVLSSGPINFQNGSNFNVDITGTVLGTGFDRLAVTGQANLNGAILNLNFASFVPAAGSTFTILTTTGGVVGAFRNAAGTTLADGSAFVIGGRSYLISYAGNNVTLTVSRAATIALASSANPSAPSQGVVFTATLTPVLSTDPPPAGTVEFRLNSATGPVLGTGALTAQPNGSAVATSPSISSLPLGASTIVAVYLPTNQFAVPGNPTLVQAVNLMSATTLTPQTAGPVLIGDTVSFLAVTTGPGPLPTGTYTFVNATTGAVLGTAPVDSTGRASFNTSNLPVGRITVQVNYSGDTNYRPSSATAIQLVGRQTRLVTGSDVGPVATVQVYDPRTRALLGSFQPFDQYTLGVKVATGDVNGDGVDDIVVAAGQGAPGGHVKVFDGRTFQELFSFFSFPGAPGTQGFTGGVNVAVGDVNGDGRADIIVGTGVANDHVKVFSGADPTQVLQSFFAFSDNGGNTVGVTVAAGDVNGDGRADVIVGSATFAGHVKAFDGTSAAEIGSYFAFGLGYLGGINVAAGDLDGNGLDEIIVGATNVAHVKALRGDGTETASFFAYQNPDLSAAQFGVRVAAADWNNDGLADIVTGAGAAAPDVRVFSGLTNALIDNFIARVLTAPTATSGVFVGGSTNPVR